MSLVYTVGHSTRPIEELVEVLREAQVEVLIDVRRFPGSKRNPQFAQAALDRSLPSNGVVYEWWGEGLGGRRSSQRKASRHPAWRNASFQGYADHMDGDEFRAAIETLEERAPAQRLCFMCAETLWWNCHRRLISDTLALRGHEVVHLLQVGKHDRHRLHPNVRSDAEGWPVYDVNVDVPLDLA